MTEMMVDVKEHPIMITLQDAISGDGFMARITLSGRALMRLEENDGKWWMYGVCPAGLAACGTNIDEAFLRFRNSYKEILFDIAKESLTFAEFSTEVQQFFNEPDSDNEDARLWENALTAIRSASNPLPEQFSHLPRQTPESHPPRITIERVDVANNHRFESKENVADKFIYSVPQAA